MINHLSRWGIVPPLGGSLEIGNEFLFFLFSSFNPDVPPSGGSLEIGNINTAHVTVGKIS